MKPFILHEGARRELREAASNETERPGSSERRLAAFEVAARKIRSNPATGQPYRAGTPQCRVQRFPYVTVFQNLADNIHIAAVAHLSRRPGYWIDRLEESGS